MDLIFDSYDLAGLRLPNRVVMAPMTRARALDDIPDDMTVLYYRQRASAGFIISEGAPVSVEGRGYLFNPALHSAEQAAGWRRVTDAVHSEGGRIFAQLWHVGRLSHTSLQPGGRAPVSATATRAATAAAFAYDEAGKPAMVPASAPRALATDEVARVTLDFVRAARLAIGAGFDGVEIHGANGYLFEQFINGGVNDRTDRYGGSIANRLRFLLETVDAVVAEIGANRVGIRISPFGRLYDMPAFEDESETWLALAAELATRQLAYVHLSDQFSMGYDKIPSDFAAAFRRAYPGTLIAAGGFDRITGERALQSGELDLIAIGRSFISNPDLVERMKNDWPLAPADRATFYGSSGAKGYTDYPRYQDSLAGQTMDDKLQTLLDHEEIRNLRCRYAHFLDGNFLERFDEIFTEDAVADTGRGQWNSRQEIQDGLRMAFNEYDRDSQGSYPFIHAVTNHWIELLGPDRAEGRCYLIDFETAAKADPNPLLLLGIYSDEYRRVDGKWRISRSRLEHVWPQRNGGGGVPGKGLSLPEKTV